MLCSSSALRCFTVFSKLNVDGFWDRCVFRAGENAVRLTLDADKGGRKALVADSGEGAVYVVVSSNDASLAAAANAFSHYPSAPHQKKSGRFRGSKTGVSDWVGRTPAFS